MSTTTTTAKVPCCIVGIGGRRLHALESNGRPLCENVGSGWHYTRPTGGPLSVVRPVGPAVPTCHLCVGRLAS